MEVVVKSVVVRTLVFCRTKSSTHKVETKCLIVFPGTLEWQEALVEPFLC